MFNKLKQLAFKQKVGAASALILIFFIYNLTVVASRIGEVKVVVSVVPKDAKISINDKAFPAGNLYMKPGKYTFSASATGWKTDTQTVDVSKDRLIVNLLPEPESEEVKSWLKNNAEVQLEREKLGGESFTIKSEEAVRKNPIIDSLPFSEVSPPFKIDFGPSKERKGDIFLIISKSSPNGRLGALKWLRQNGVDPTDYEIFFSDFINPLAPKKEYLE